MSTQVTLKAERREESGKGAARKLRAAGRVPAVVYGKDVDTVSLSLDAGETQHLFQSISVENTIVELALDGEDAPVPTLIREVQVHPVRPDLLHVDFYRIQEGVRVEVEIPLHLVGVPEGVKHSGGILQQVIHDLPIRVLPSQIPDSFEMDVSHLDMNESIHLSDLEVDEGVEILFDLERTVASVVAPKAILPEEEEEEEVEEIEVPLMGEEVEEGEEGEAPAEGEESPEA